MRLRSGGTAVDDDENSPSQTPQTLPKSLLRNQEGIFTRLIGYLRSFAASWWYPWLVGLFTAVNMFVLVFSATNTVNNINNIPL